MTALSTPRLVSYAPDGSTCTLNFDGEEYYYDCVGTTSTVDNMREKEIAMLREMLAKREDQLAEAQKDAERYRWLRAEHDRVDPLGRVVWKSNHDRNSHRWCDVFDLDGLIDEAIKEGK